KPDYVDAYNNLGIALAKQGKVDEAIINFQRAVSLKPDSVDSLSNLAHALARQEKIDEAIETLRRALGLQPNSADAHSSLGTYLAGSGHFAEADAHWREALRLKDTPRVRVLRAMLLPPLYQSNADLWTWRQRLIDELGRLQDDGVIIDIAQEKAVPVFYLVYQ